MVTTDTEHFGLLGPLKASGAAIRVAEVRAKPPEEALDAILAQIGAEDAPARDLPRLLADREPPAARGAARGDGRPDARRRGAVRGAIAVDAAPYDFYTVSGQKWLCGPDATGALYVRDPEALAVALPTYFSQETHEANGEYVPRAGAARFDGGWLATSSLAGLEAALATVPHWALHHSRDIAARCWALLRSASRSSPRPARRRSPRSSPRATPPPPPRALRAGRRHPGPARHRLAARLVRLVDERRRSRPAAGRSSSGSSERPALADKLKGETSAGPPSAVRSSCVAHDR